MKRWKFVLAAIAMMAAATMMAGCGGSDDEYEPAPSVSDNKQEEYSDEDEEVTAPEPENDTENDAPQANQPVGGIRSDFKAAMDSYESFMNEYVDFMKKYSANPSDMGLLAEYSKYMSKLSEMTENFEKWDDEEMTDAEAAYYLDVQTRVNKKLLEVDD